MYESPRNMMAALALPGEPKGHTQAA